MMYERKDFYYRRAKEEGFRARSAYKLLEIQKKYGIIPPDSDVLDIGCAPGSWAQVARTLTHGRVVGVDLVPMDRISGVLFIQGDVRDTEVQKQLGTFNVILSDTAPKTSGTKVQDQFLSLELSQQSFMIAKKHLRKNGALVVKTFQSQETEELIKEIKQEFDFVKRYTPQATRHGSKEIYIIATGFRKA
ncbi:MAG TPA: RlmE family RNA methyltransferase [Candidatus Nanoarchaeia archaeon]|nr:RlmE family RNA methyltransferase [Candidatus Nanoarchaeia archaeon]